MENILIVGAHFDDTELGVGGTAAKLSQQGKKVYKLTLTDDNTQSEILGLNIDFESSQKDSANAVETLGIEEIDFQPLPCRGLKYNAKDMQRIESIIYDLKIDTVFSHFHKDLNQDHIAAFELCKTAARHCPNFLMYQSNAYLLEEAFYPTVFVDISEQFELKRKSLEKYSAQHNRFGKLFSTALKRNEIWGFQTKCNAAEGFVPLRLMFGE